MTIDDIREQVCELIANSPRANADKVTLAGVERLVVRHESVDGYRRTMRITPAFGGGDWDFEVLWSSYGAPSPHDNRDGRFGGTTAFVLAAIRHWIVDEMRWQDVPEFKHP